MQSKIVVIIIIAVASLSGCGDNGETLGIERVSTFARLDGKLAEPFGLAVSGPKTYVTDGACGCVFLIEQGKKSLLTSGLNAPGMIAADEDGSLVVADTGSHTIKRIEPSGNASIIAGVTGQQGFADGEAGQALFSGPIGIAIDAQRRIWVTDTYNDKIRVIEDNVVRTISGSTRGFADGQGGVAEFDTPLGIAVFDKNTVVIADHGNARLRLVAADGDTTTLAGNGQIDRRDGSLGNASLVGPTGVSVDPIGRIFITDGDSVRAIGLRAVPMIETIAGRERGFNNGDAFTARFNRPSGIVSDDHGSILIADSENGSIRRIDANSKTVDAADESPHRLTADEFRSLAPGRWPYDPPNATRDIAGTLGEIRGTMTPSKDNVWYHNGLDIAGNYGESARFIRDETVLDPAAIANFATSRELIRMPTLGYIHIRIGRRATGELFDDQRFRFDRSSDGKLSGVRVARGSKFAAGDAIGTLNSMNHVHLIAGRRGYEFNALNALDLPGVADRRPPTIVAAYLLDSRGQRIETTSASGRIIVTESFRPVLRAFDQMDGNPERRKLGVYKLGWHLLGPNGGEITPIDWTIEFDRMPETRSLPLVYADGSYSGATGETIFDYIVSSRVNGSGSSFGQIDISQLPAGDVTVRLFAADIFGNTSTRDIAVTIKNQ